MSLNELKPGEPENKLTPYWTILCPIHPKIGFDFYCETCESLICFVCSGGQHKHHEFTSIAVIIDRKRAELDESVRELKGTKLYELTNILKTLGQETENYEEETQNLISQINKRAHELKEEVDKIRDQLIAELKQKREAYLKTLQQSEQKYTSQLKEMKSLLKTTEERINSMGDTELLQNLGVMKTKLSYWKTNLMKPNFLSRPRFVSAKSESDANSLTELYGQLDNSQHDNKLSENKDAHLVNMPTASVSQFHSKHGAIYHVCFSDKKELWIYTEKRLTSLKRDGRELQTKQLGFFAQDSAVTLSGDLLLTECEKHTMWKMSSTGEITSFVNTSPFEPYGISVTENDSILVSLRHAGQGIVERLSSDGQILHTYQYDASNKSALFTNPFKLIQNVNGDMWVIDGECVVVVDTSVKRRFKYKGQNIPKINEGFYPNGISHNKYGQVVITDYFNKIVHLVDKDGVFLQYVMTEQDGSFRPLTVKHDSDGYLWIGCNGGKLFSVKYFQ